MVTTLDKQLRDELIDVERQPARADRLYVCAECKYAQLFAVQPRAVCTCQSSASAGRIVFAGRPACADMSPRADTELILAMSAASLHEPRGRLLGASLRIH